MARRRLGGGLRTCAKQNERKPERSMPILRRAKLSDLDFLSWIDREDEGVSSSQVIGRSDADLERHRRKIREFIDDDDKVAFVLVDEISQESM